MTLDALMNQTVTLKRLSGEARDSIGGSTLIYTTVTTTMYLQPGSQTGAGLGGHEQEAERNTPIGDWFGVGRATVDFLSCDQVVYGDHVLDIVAPPRLIPNPRLGTSSHWEIDLREVDGDTPSTEVVPPSPTLGPFSDGFDMGFE